jgi:hypothetical protein
MHVLLCLALLVSVPETAKAQPAIPGMTAADRTTVVGIADSMISARFGKMLYDSPALRDAGLHLHQARTLLYWGIGLPLLAGAIEGFTYAAVVNFRQRRSWPDYGYPWGVTALSAAVLLASLGCDIAAWHNIGGAGDALNP